jgi:hypothetical protein
MRIHLRIDIGLAEKVLVVHIVAGDLEEGAVDPFAGKVIGYGGCCVSQRLRISRFLMTSWCVNWAGMTHCIKEAG